jgi:aldose 1-epimerase
MNTKFWVNLVLTVTVVCMPGCKKKQTTPPEPNTGKETTEVAEMSAKKESFGQTPEGREADLYTLTNSNGLRARITNYGAILVSLEVPDRDGNLADITLGFDSLEGYLGEHPYFGAVVGRYANRIGNAEFVLEGVKYELAANNGENHLHGGIKGFDKVIWKLEDLKTEDDSATVKLSYVSEAGEEGYPGNLACSVTYALTEDNGLQMSYEADTDKTTVVNLTNHTYFNLAGQGTGDILDHEIMIDADKYTVVDANLIPTGELRSVTGTPMDFTISATIGSRIDQVEGGGYDHNYVLNSDGGDSLDFCARVYERTSGRVMEVYTTEPGVQFYTGNFLDGTVIGKGGKAYEKHYGFCLETQHFPDSPNKPQFPSAVLKPGQKYSTRTVLKFSTRQ